MRTPVPEAVGEFQWARASYGEGEGCEMWSSERLTVQVAKSGAVTWSALVNGDARCSGGIVAPTNCGASGEGYLSRTDQGLRLVTFRRGAYGGVGAPAVVALWQCGSFRVRTPIDVVPEGVRACTRIGSEENPVVARASATACAYAPPFPELDDPGVRLSVDGKTLQFQHGKRTITLRRPR